jgi:hypothetical protein
MPTILSQYTKFINEIFAFETVREQYFKYGIGGKTERHLINEASVCTSLAVRQCMMLISCMITLYISFLFVQCIFDRSVA